MRRRATMLSSLGVGGWDVVVGSVEQVHRNPWRQPVTEVTGELEVVAEPPALTDGHGGDQLEIISDWQSRAVHVRHPIT